MSLAVVSEHTDDERDVIERLRGAREKINSELSKVIIGQKQVIEELLIGLFSGGHCLITGAPGLAKTLLVQSVSDLFHLKFSRIQFTPDLMPADITGTEILEQNEEGQRKMVFVPGPIFANVVLADEINRTPPKTQSALLEAMQEKQVTAAGRRMPLEPPFFVLATQNPIEMEGTYPLPEAQLDRFMFNIMVEYLPEDEEVAVVMQTTGAAVDALKPIFEGSELIAFRDAVRSVPIAEDVARYAVRLASASRPHEANTPSFINDWVNWGAGLRAGQYLVLGGKARALLNGQSHVSIEDIRAMAHPTMRHRILVNYRAEADGVSVETVIDKLLETVQPPA
ncbi:MAG: MoxR family ATPase [Planctomycetota bacterium]|nr:MoxR family ATPase [Planctomycetota bacterium]MDA1251744.1 MoxR family ATPase [Planctomycetota bacterium]